MSRLTFLFGKILLKYLSIFILLISYKHGTASANNKHSLCLCISFTYTSIRRHLDYTSARLRRAVKVSSLFSTRFTDLKTEKNGGFRADPLAKYHRFLFFGILFKDFRKILYAKMRHVPLRTGALASAILVI